MKSYKWMVWGALAVAALVIAAQSVDTARAEEAKILVVPEKAVLTPDLLKEPIQFKGTGFGPGEVVVVELIPPAGLKVKAVAEGENVGLAFATTDDKGAFDAKMSPVATLNWIFQVGWTPNMKPDFKEAKPLPPGSYQILATGMTSGKAAKATLELLKPPPKEEKK